MMMMKTIITVIIVIIIIIIIINSECRVSQNSIQLFPNADGKQNACTCKCCVKNVSFTLFIQMGK